MLVPKGHLLPSPAENAGAQFQQKTIVPKARQIVRERSCTTVKMCRAFGTWFKRVAIGPAISYRAGQQHVPLALAAATMNYDRFLPDRTINLSFAAIRQISWRLKAS